MATTEPNGMLPQSVRTVATIAGYAGAAALNFLLIRTDFTNDGAWDRLVDSVTTPVAVPGVDGGAAPGDLVFVNDHSLSGYRPRQLVELLGEVPPFCIFIVDSQSMTEVEQTVAAVQLHGAATTERPLRVALDVLWMVENSLLTATMSFADFVAAADSDGVFRGFGTAQDREGLELAHVAIPSPTAISNETLRSLLAASPASDGAARAALDAEWDVLNFVDLEFVRLPARSIRANLEDIDRPVTASHLGYDAALKDLDRDGDVLAAGCDLPDGYWEFFLEPETRAPIAVHRYKFR